MKPTALRRKLILTFSALLCSVSLATAETPLTSPEEEQPHVDPATLATEDEVLREQILKVNDALEDLHQQIAQHRKKLQAATTDSERASVYARLDALRKEHDMLERLLHELVEEAKATEWTKVDEALRQARGLERYQEKQQRREDVLRDRRE